MIVRDGKAHDVDAREVGCGVVLRLAAGDIVPADARLDSTESMQVDEWMLTSESMSAVVAAWFCDVGGVIVALRISPSASSSWRV